MAIFKYLSDTEEEKKLKEGFEHWKSLADALSAEFDSEFISSWTREEMIIFLFTIRIGADFPILPNTQLEPETELKLKKLGIRYELFENEGESWFSVDDPLY